MFHTFFMEINGYELVGIAFNRADGPMWRTRTPSGEHGLLTMHTQGDADRHLERWQSWAGMDSPHVVRLFDVITHQDGRWSLIQAEVHGNTLAFLLESHDDVLKTRSKQIIAGIEDGVRALHAAGITHGDLSPSNIIITPDGQPVIIDMIGPLGDEEGTAGWSEGPPSPANDEAAVARIAQAITSLVNTPRGEAAQVPHSPGVRLRTQSSLPMTHRREAVPTWAALFSSEERAAKAAAAISHSKAEISAEDSALDNAEESTEPADAEEGASGQGQRAGFGGVLSRSRPLHMLTVTVIAALLIVVGNRAVTALGGAQSDPALRGPQYDGPISASQPHTDPSTRPFLGAQPSPSANPGQNTNPGLYTNPSPGANAGESPHPGAGASQSAAGQGADPGAVASAVPGAEGAAGGQCDAEGMVERLHAALKARDAAYNHASAEGLDQYLSGEVLVSDMENIATMQAQNTRIDGFQTAVSAPTMIECSPQRAVLEAGLSAANYTVCDAQGCRQAKGTRQDSPRVVLTLSGEERLLSEVKEAPTHHAAPS